MNWLQRFLEPLCRVGRTSVGAIQVIFFRWTSFWDFYKILRRKPITFFKLSKIDKSNRWLTMVLLAFLLLMPAKDYSKVVPYSPNTHIISIGINVYKGSEIPQIRYAVADAKAFIEAFEAPEREGIRKHILLGEDATKESIEAAFNQVIREAKSWDLFIFYFAGHSASKTSDKLLRDFYLIPFDCERTSYRNLQLEAISANSLKAWTSRMQSSRQLLIFDTNNAKEVVANFTSRVMSEGVEAMSLSDRRIKIMGPADFAYENSKLGHGNFTNDLLKGLNGEADRYPRDGFINAEELDIFSRVQAALRSSNEADSKSITSFYVNHRISSASFGADFVIKHLKDFRGVRELKNDEEPTQKTKESRGQDYALLIATSNYDSWKHLPNPLIDARAIASDLMEIYNFEAEIIEDPTLDEIFAALGEYTKKKFFPNDQLFIFIAGHGTYFDNTREGFLIGRDSKSRQDDPYGTTYVPHARLRDIINLIPVKHIFLVIDACFGGTFDQRIAEAGSRGDDEYADITAEELKARKMKHTTRRYLTSGGKEYVPDGRPRQHSPFARKLLEALRSYGGKDRYLTINEILQYIEKVTPEPRAGEFGDHEPGGDLVFLHKSK